MHLQQTVIFEDCALPRTRASTGCNWRRNPTLSTAAGNLGVKHIDAEDAPFLYDSQTDCERRQMTTEYRIRASTVATIACGVYAASASSIHIAQSDMSNGKPSSTCRCSEWG